MNIDRRRILIGASALIASGMIGSGAITSKVAPVHAGPAGDKIADPWHPLTRSLLERACRIQLGRDAPDRAMVERTIRQLADTSSWTKPLVIKWMDTPTDAHEHLSRFGLDALLDIGTTSFWRRAQPPVPRDEETFDRVFEVRMMANELLGVESHDRTLMSPKLLAKSRAMAANLSASDTFRARAVSSQIGWLETSMADVAAQAVTNVELLLSTGVPEGSMAIDHQLKVFGSYEHGLLATWDTPDALICVFKV
jgi:hypothetical protein